MFRIQITAFGSITRVSLVELTTYLGKQVVGMEPASGWFVDEASRRWMLLLLLLLVMMVVRHAVARY